MIRSKVVFHMLLIHDLLALLIIPFFLSYRVTSRLWRGRDEQESTTVLVN